MAAARKASSATRTSTTTNGFGAARSPTLRRQFSTASAPRTGARARRRCRASALDKLLDDAKIFDAAEYVLSLSNRAQDQPSAQRGAAIYKEQCVSCHGDDGKGKIAEGAPGLTDGIWLFGGSREAIVESIRTGRGAGMPAWVGRLDPVTIKALTIYVHSLGGGQ